MAWSQSANHINFMLKLKCRCRCRIAHSMSAIFMEWIYILTLSGIRVIIFHQQALITILSKLCLKYFDIHFNTDDDVNVMIEKGQNCTKRFCSFLLFTVDLLIILNHQCFAVYCYCIRNRKTEFMTNTWAMCCLSTPRIRWNSISIKKKQTNCSNQFLLIFLSFR